jgi:hypothetical protein
VYGDAGVVVPETAYVRVSINGEPRGVYLLVETTDRDFLERRFGDGGGILYEGAYGTDLRAADAPRFELDEGKDPDRAALNRLIQAVEASGDTVLYGQDALVDTPSFLSMMAVAAVISDWDNYYTANNYRIYWNPRTRRWSFIPTGIDQSFTKDETTAFGAKSVLFRKCLESRRCTSDYAAAVRRVVDRFGGLDLPRRMDALVSLLDEPIKADPKRPYSTATMSSAREKMRRFIEARPGVIRQELDRATASRPD